MRVGREPMRLAATATEVLRRLRGRPRLVALIGAGWSPGEAVIACEPVRELQAWDAIDLPAADDAEGFGGGWIGAWGYQLAGRVESLPSGPARPHPQPPLRVGFYDVVLRRANGDWWLEWLEGADPNRIERLRGAVSTVSGGAEPHAFDVGELTMTPAPAEHVAAVSRAIERIHAGDIFQVNVCARLEGSYAGDPLDAFCAGVEQLAPAFAAYVSDAHGAIASWSPELFLRRHGTTVLSSPIKGTAPLAADPAELLGSAKDRAENVMIVDLMRNDLGRVAEPGTVAVPALTRLERHAVWHLVSDVSAEVAVPDSALLYATFPPGSVTGAPKVRAMELIATELESVGREAYTGAIGYVSPAAGLELNVAIRTLEFADGRIWLGAGGGIVADSDPVAELAECFVKARPLAAALGASLADEPGEPVAAAPVHRDTPVPADPSAGVFTTVLVREGRPVGLDAHLSRLEQSVRELYGQELSAEAAQLVRGRADALQGPHRLRLEVSATGHLSLTAAPLAPLTQPWRLARHRLANGLGAHKWVDRQALARLRSEPLIIGSDEAVLETGRASIFAVFDDGVHTPPLDGRILPGTMRARTIARARERGIPVYERPFTTRELATASEVFATNALRGIVPVAEVEELGSWPAPGPVTATLSEPSAPTPPAREAPPGTRVLFVDNHDSFVFNLVQYTRELGAEVEVVRSDAPVPSLSGVTHVVVSPGPGGPDEAGISAEVVRRALDRDLPVLGVCLGHQVLGDLFGARVARAPSPVHGKPALVHHDGRGIFSGLASPFTAARYHSLIVEKLPAELEVTAETGSGVLMGLRHRSLPLEGVQFHPESVLTQHGHVLLGAFLARPTC